MNQINQSNYYNILNWKQCDVESWVKGLDPSLSAYFPLKDIVYDGKWLMNLTLHDLKSTGIDKVGHAMLFLEAVRVLIEELHFHANDNLQNAIFKVSCDANILINLVDKLLRMNAMLEEFLKTKESMFYKTREEAETKDELYPGQLDEIQVTKMVIVSSVLRLVKSVRVAVSWMNKPNFSHMGDLIEMKKGLIEDLKRVNFYAQMLVGEKQNQKLADIKGVANMVKYRTEVFIDTCKDSLYLTPCIIENVLIHKADNMVFGINVKTVFNNLHVIESIDFNTPAYNVGKLEEGDEILEINNQVVIGWQHQQTIMKLLSHPKKLCLRLRKKPAHHTSESSCLLGGGRRKMNYGGGGSGSRMQQEPGSHIRAGVLSRPSKRGNTPHSSGSASTPATPVLLAKVPHETDSAATATVTPTVVVASSTEDRDSTSPVAAASCTSPSSLGSIESHLIAAAVAAEDDGHITVTELIRKLSSVGRNADQSRPGSEVIAAPIITPEDAAKIEDAAGSEGEYSAADASPYVLSRHRHRNLRYRSGSGDKPLLAGAVSTATSFTPSPRHITRPDPDFPINYESDFLSPPTTRRQLDNQEPLVDMRSKKSGIQPRDKLHYPANIDDKM